MGKKTKKQMTSSWETLRTLEGHRYEVACCVWNEDGSLLASGSYDKTVRLWNPGRSGGPLVRKLIGHECRVSCCAWNKDGSLLASGSSDKTLRLWRPDGSLVATLEGHGSGVRCCAWKEDGSLLASGSNDKTLRLWNPDGSLVMTLEGHESDVTCCAWNDKHGLLASGSYDSTLRLWGPDGSLVELLEGHRSNILCCAWNKDGSLLASGSYNGTLRLWEPNGLLSAKLDGHGVSVTSVQCCAWNHDGSLLASGYFDKTVRLWKPDGSLVATLEGHGGWVGCCAWNHDGSLLASGSYDQTLKLWWDSSVKEVANDDAQRKKRKTEDQRKAEIINPTSIDPAFVNLIVEEVPPGGLEPCVDANNNPIILGEGGFGQVIKGTLHGHGDVAVKRVRPDRMTSGMLEDFQREVVQLFSLRSPFIVQAVGFPARPEDMFLAMEFMSGGSLCDALHRSNDTSWLDWDKAGKRVLEHVARGLNYLHTRSPPLIHRDLKSPNVLLSHTGERNVSAKVADVGSIKEKLQTFVSVSGSGFTTAYAPPEVRQVLLNPRPGQGDLRQNEKVDVFAWGVLLWEVLNKRVPSVYNLEPPTNVTSEVIKELFKSCTHEDPNVRPSSASLVDELAQMTEMY